MTFYQRFRQITRQKASLLCVGLDPDLRRMPECMRQAPDPLFAFCREIVSHTHKLAAAFKLNLAFFEAEGSRGWAALEKLMQDMPADVLTIADAKRGDIGTTSEMYARAILERLNFDAVTVNPYLGRDSVEPFLQWEEKGAFVLCLTSNPGAHDFQYFSDGVRTLYDKVLEKVNEWNTRGNCGLVVGATHPEELAAIRKAAPQLPFLIPGVGIQGGDLRTAVSLGTTTTGEQALFNFSRGIIYKSVGTDFAEAAARQAEALRNEINEVRRSKSC